MNEQRKEQPAVQEAPVQPTRKRGGWKKLFKGKGRKLLALVLVVAVAAGFLAYKNKGSQQAAAATVYQEAEMEHRTITKSLSSSGSLEPADSYTVSTLVDAEILSDTFEEGDLVEKGQLLYTLDSSDASSSLTQSQNSLTQAQNNYDQAVKNKYPTADMSGTVSEVYVKNGDTVNAGTALLKIVGDNNIYMNFIFTYANNGDFYVGQPATVFINDMEGSISGTVVAVSSGSTVSDTGRVMTTVRVKGQQPRPGHRQLHRPGGHRQLLQLRQRRRGAERHQHHHRRDLRQGLRIELAGRRHHQQRRPRLHHHRRQCG